MKPTAPDPSGSGDIHITTNGQRTQIKIEGTVIVLAQLFYEGLRHVPYTYEAMKMAIHRFDEEHPGQPDDHVMQ